MRPLLLCPTQYEASRLRSTAASLGAEMHVVGVGLGCEQAIRALAADQARGRVAVMAGIAGAVAESATIGAAFAADRVVDEHGSVHHPTLPCTLPRLTLCCSRVVVVGEAARSACAASTGAAMVDMESGPFARVASSCGWRWSVLRGISDDAAVELPAEVMRWLRPDGGTNWVPLASDLITRPRLWSPVRRMVRHASSAMRSVATHLPSLLGRA